MAEDSIDFFLSQSANDCVAFQIFMTFLWSSMSQHYVAFLPSERALHNLPPPFRAGNGK